MKKTSGKLIAVALTTWAVLGICTQAPTASASHRRGGSVNCKAYNDTKQIGMLGSLLVAYSDLEVVCPFPSDSTLRHNNVQTLNLHGVRDRDEEGSFSRACAVDYASSAVACGAQREWWINSTGLLNVDTSAWQANSGWYPYIWHNLKQDDGMYYWGYYASD